MGTSSFIPSSSTSSFADTDDDDSSMTSLELVLSIAVGVLLVTTVVLGVLVSGSDGNGENLIQNADSGASSSA
mgnify:FL=1